MSTTPAPVRTRVADLLGIDYPIIQAPMGWIARAQLASAVSNAGGLGIIETSSGELDAIRTEIVRMRELTDRPFGVNIAQLFVRDPSIVDFVVEQGVKFVTTSAGDPNRFTASRTRATWRRWCCCPSSPRWSTCRSWPPAGSATGARWPPPSLSGLRGCRWARG